MPWLRGGTVAVTNGSTTVVGTNADFAANAKNGDAFVGPDGANYEIGNVASATVISIIPAYKGPTASGVAYAIMPVQGYPKALADAFSEINRQWGATLSALGTTGNYDVLPTQKGGTGITDLSIFMQGLLNDADDGAARQTLGAAKSGANNDITSLTGLTTALPVSLGGTGGKTQAAARTGLGLGSAAVAAIVGAVSQSGGVPTGAIIERGSNANGEFTKFADGTAIARTLYRIIRTPSTPTGALFFGGGMEPAKPFPITFVDVPIVSVQGALETGEGWFVPASSKMDSTTYWPGGYIFTQLTRGVPQILSIHYTAIGRWF